MGILGKMVKQFALKSLLRGSRTEYMGLFRMLLQAEGIANTEVLWQKTPGVCDKQPGGHKDWSRMSVGRGQ